MSDRTRDIEDAAFELGFRAGAAAMRDASAAICDKRVKGYKSERDKIDMNSKDAAQVASRVRWNAKAYVCESNAKDIRALSLPEPGA